MVSRHTDDQALVPIGEAARLLGVSISSLRRWEREGKLVALRTPAGHRRFRRADLDALVSAA